MEKNTILQGTGADQRAPAASRRTAGHLAAHSEQKIETVRKGGRAAILCFLKQAAATPDLHHVGRRSPHRTPLPWQRRTETVLRRSLAARKSAAVCSITAKADFARSMLMPRCTPAKWSQFQHAVDGGKAPRDVEPHRRPDRRDRLPGYQITVPGPMGQPPARNPLPRSKAPGVYRNANGRDRWRSCGSLPAAGRRR